MLRFKYDCPHDALTPIAFTLPYMAYEITVFCQVMSQNFNLEKRKSPQDLAELPLIYPPVKSRWG